MDVVRRENITVANSLIVSGLTLTELDNELEAYLLRYGSIRRNVIIDDPASDFHKLLIVEFNENSAFQTLHPHLPLTLGSLSDPSITFRVRALAAVCDPPVVSTATEGYLEQLKAIAKESGRPFQTVLQEELEKLKETHSVDQTLAESQKIEVADTQSRDNTLISESPNVAEIDPQDSESKNPTKNRIIYVSPPSPETTADDNLTTVFPSSSTNIMGDAQVQRMVVEHVVKTSDAMMSQQTSIRLRVFSGKSPRPPNEPDYDTWRASVDYLLNDPSISDLHRTRKILDSLLPPAADVVKHVRPPALPAVYLELLESVYGSVEDGDELLAKLMGTFQNQNEKSSDYLHRLQVLLSAVIRRGGIKESERDRYLLKQFCRGCWDSRLIVDLQLEKKEGQLLTFAELTILIRTQEDKNASKEERMRKHFGMTKPANVYPKTRAISNQVSACACDVSSPYSSEAGSLKKQVAEIQAQVATLKQSPDKKSIKGQSERAELVALKRTVEDLCVQVAAVKASVAEGLKGNNPEQSEIARLQRQVAELQAQGIVQKAYQAPHMQRSPGTEIGRALKKEPLRTNRPRPGYCFRCGDDGHLAVNCENPANPPKVEEKRLKLREQQHQWDMLHGRPAQFLN